MDRREGRNRRPLVWLSLVFVALGLAAAFTGCAPTMLMNVWRDPSIAPPRLTKFLVISLRNDPVRRRMWEDAFSTELSKHGVTAMASYRLYPNAAPDTAQMRAALSSKDYNGVLSISPLPPKVEREYVWNEPDVWFSPFWGRYYRQWYYLQDPGYVATFTFRRNEIDVYMTHGGAEQLAWSGTSEMTEPATMEDVRNSVVMQVVSRLSEQGIIPHSGNTKEGE